MYVPEHFAETRLQQLHDLIDQTGLGTLIVHGRAGLDASHVPFDLDRRQGSHGALHCHLARANSMWQDINEGDEVLVVFKRAAAYVSPQWYPSKQEFHRQVPTWNYLVAHVYGRVTVHDDERYVRGNVARLTRKHEATQPVPWKMTDAPADYLDAMLKAIVGVEIEITRIIGKFKLSQNKEPRDIQGAGEALSAQGDVIIGAAMKGAATIKAGKIS